jgi:hypothetical protein
MALDQINQEIASLSKEKDTLEDLARRETLETNHHSGRAHTKYVVTKVISPDGDFLCLYEIQSRTGKPLPKELQQQFTSVEGAVKAIKAYENRTKFEKENS